MTGLPLAAPVDGGRSSSQMRPDNHHKFIDLTRNAPASLLGGHSVSAPPDPISNSAVKPDCADGTYAQALEE